MALFEPRPRDYSDVAIETGHLLRLAFGRPWRQTEGLSRSLAVGAALLVRPRRDQGLVQLRVTRKTRNPFTTKALSIFGVTWKWHFLNHALRDSPTANALEAIVDLDLIALADIEPPRGYGRD